MTHIESLSAYRLLMSLVGSAKAEQWHEWSEGQELGKFETYKSCAISLQAELESPILNGGYVLILPLANPPLSLSSLPV